jgi:hypothetical protein
MPYYLIRLYYSSYSLTLLFRWASPCEAARAFHDRKEFAVRAPVQDYLGPGCP